MLDRLLNTALWLTVMGMISTSAAAALIVGYHGLFNICAGRYHGGAFAVAVGVALAGSSYVLFRHCNDLIDR